MRKNTITLLLLVALVFGFSTQAFAKQVTVQKGDTMWIIAKRYNVPFSEVLKLNRHFTNQNLIYPGQKIEIPDHNAGTGTSTGNNSSTDKIPENNQKPTESTTSSQAQTVIDLVNKERSKQGLKPLMLSSTLTSISNTKAKDMAANNYFSHTSPTYGTPFQMLQRFGVTYRTAGENIAAGQRTPQEVMNAWMNSSGHRANILNANYTELGVGYYKGGSYGTEWVQLFIGK